MSVTPTSRVATERGERYRKQLASHFGNKIEVVEEAQDPPGVRVGADGSGGRTSTARGRLGSRRRKPLRSSIDSWCATDDVDARPADSQISRMLGG